MKEHIRLSERIIRAAFPELSKPQQKVMAQSIVALSDTENFTLSDIASRFQGESDVKHKLKKLQYFLDGLNLNKLFWQSYIKLILALPNLKLSKREKITITISSNNLGNSFKVITASISYKNKTLPIYLKLWEITDLPNELSQEVETLIQSIKELLPEKHKYLIISDNSKYDTNLVNILSKQNIDFIVRIRPKSLRLKDATNYTDIELFPDGVYQGAGTDESVQSNNTNVAIISMLSEDNERSGIYFSCSLTDKDEVFRYFSNRIFFEEDLNCLIHELKWSKYSKKTPNRSRFEKLLILSCVSYAIHQSDEADLSKNLQHILVNLTRSK